MIQRLKLLIGVVLVSVFSAPAVAAPIVLPPGLNTGDTYRLVFITAGTSNAVSPAIGTYDTFIQSQLSPELTALANPLEWRVIGSTSAIEAIHHTSTNPGDQPASFQGFYLTNGQQIASSYVDLWDGFIANPIQFDQDGMIVSANSVWTGTVPSGMGPDGSELGSATVRIGSNTQVDGRWVSTVDATNSIALPFYGISPVLTVGPAVPEPASLTLLAIGLVGFAGYRWRHHRELSQDIET